MEEATRTLATIAALALALTGCTTGRAAVEGSPPVRHVTISGLPEQPTNDPDRPLKHPAVSLDRDDPAAVAVTLIEDGLAEEGLQLLDVGVQTRTSRPGAATVRIAATHQAQGGTRHTSIYELDLARHPKASWRVVTFHQSQ